MRNDVEDYKPTYSRMTDEQLVQLAEESDSLVEEARNALWAELRERGLGQEAARAYQKHLSERLVTIGTFTPIKVQLAKTKLESAGIQCVVADERSRMSRFFRPYLRGIKLQVKEPDVERAATVLHEMDEEDNR